MPVAHATKRSKPRVNARTAKARTAASAQARPSAGPRFSRRWIIPIVVVSVILGCSLAYLVAGNWYVLDVHTRAVTYRVVAEGGGGFDTNTSLLIFGKLPQGGGGIRHATLVSRIPAVAHIRMEPDVIRDTVVASAYRIPLDADVPYEVHFTATIPPDMPVGVYNGTIQVTYTRRMPWE